jgi:hypothetical protein
MARDKKCPKCAETVKADAKVCRFCGHQFPDVAASPKMGIGKKVLIAFGGLFAVGMLAQLNPSSKTGAQSSSDTKVNIDPDKKDKDMAAYLAKQAVPAALKDPSSADFDEVWGMSSTVACGYVNAKNSFGAMAGKTRFIYSSGRVVFENSGGGFPRIWNSTCIDKPHAAAPNGAAGMRWGASPTSGMKNILPTTDEGLTLFTPKSHPGPLEGVQVAEADYAFQHRKLYSADFYIDGEAGRDAILKCFVSKYGGPQQYDESLGTYTWKWPSQVQIKVFYKGPTDGKAQGRTMVTYSKDDK